MDLQGKLAVRERARDNVRVWHETDMPRRLGDV
jgi:hypothetical protein